MDTFEIRNDRAVYNGILYEFDKLPENVVFDGGIDLYYINLSKLPNMPLKLPNMSTWTIKGWFDCSCNCLTSLLGCPKEVGDDFKCSCNNLTSLEYCPKEVGGNFACSYNKLTSLKHCPEKIGKDFYWHTNKIKVIDSWPEFIGGDLLYHNNPIKLIKEGAMPLKYLIEFYKKGLYNSKELLMKYFGVDSEEELNAYLLMMGEI